MFLGLQKDFDLRCYSPVTALNIFFFGFYPLCPSSTITVRVFRNEHLNSVLAQIQCVVCIHYSNTWTDI